MLDTFPHITKIPFPSIQRKALEIVQINLGYRCNQQCQHCHVNASPKRTEMMSEEVLLQTLDFISNNHIKTVDLTGGAPEMHPMFSFFIKSLSALGVRIIDRCNLTILNESGYEYVADLFAEYAVEVVASMPCYLEENVNKQRGKGVFSSSIKSLKQLNKLGYGKPDSGLILNLVFNPQGASLAPEQAQLEKDYKNFLHKEFGITFNHLFTITNVPIKRFGSMLLSKNDFDDYMHLLRQSYHEENLGSVMCRNQLSIDWQGYLYDCDFNQMLDMPLTNNGNKMHISKLNVSDLDNREILVAGHCYACTAGQGSSCGGALS